MWLVTVSSLLLLVWRSSGQQQRDPLILRVYPFDTSEDAQRVLVREPPLKKRREERRLNLSCSRIAVDASRSTEGAALEKSNSRASVSTTHSTHTTFSTKTRSKFSHSHSPSTTKKSPSKTGSSSLHDTRKHHQSNPTRSQAAPTSRSIELVGSSWGSVTPTSRTIGSARSRGGSAVRSQLAQTDRTSSEISRVPTTKKPGRLQRIKEKLPAITEKLKEKLRPKLPAITAAAKKYGPKVEKTTTPRPMTGTAYSTSWRSANMATASPTVLTITKAADGDEIFIEYNDDFHSECPEEVDAFLQLGNVSFIFEAHHLFLVEDGSLNQTTAISNLFPGVHKVDASVYDAKQELILLFKERKVFGFHWNEGHDNFTLADNFPKDLPESIKFTPDGAFTWHDGYPVLVSNSGEFVIYDSHWNNEIDIGRAGEKYLQSLPLDTQGLSDWEDKKAIVFAKAKVYEYDVETKSVVGEEANLSDFFGCYFVDIPSSTRI